MKTDRHIVATSGGFRPNDRWGWDVGPLVRYALDLSGADSPRLCYLGTATGDDPARTAQVYAACARAGIGASHLALFPLPNVADIGAHLRDHDVIWVGGGSVANLLSLWRLHGVDVAMRDAWEAGVVMGGVSAGSICWHVGGTTDSFGPDLRAVTDALGFLPFSNGVHYDSEEQRRPLFQSLIAGGTLPSGFATDDGAGLHYGGTEMVDALCDRESASAWWIERTPDGSAVETKVDTRLLR